MGTHSLEIVLSAGCSVNRERSQTQKEVEGGLGLKAIVQVQSIEQGKATFKINFAHGGNQQVEMSDGQSKEINDDRGAGKVRIQVKEITSGPSG